MEINGYEFDDSELIDIPLSEKDREFWANALESDNYAQGKSFLKSGPFHCCLGVWAVIKELPISRTLPNGVIEFEGKLNFLEEKHIPSNVQFSLASLNDAGVSFKEIAKVIRSGKVPTSTDIEYAFQIH